MCLNRLNWGRESSQNKNKNKKNKQFPNYYQWCESQKPPHGQEFDRKQQRGTEKSIFTHFMIKTGIVEAQNQHCSLSISRGILSRCFNLVYLTSREDVLKSSFKYSHCRVIISCQDQKRANYLAHRCRLSTINFNMSSSLVWFQLNDNFSCSNALKF